VTRLFASFSVKDWLKFMGYSMIKAEARKNCWASREILVRACFPFMRVTRVTSF